MTSHWSSLPGSDLVVATDTAAVAVRLSSIGSVDDLAAVAAALLDADPAGALWALMGARPGVEALVVRPGPASVGVTAIGPWSVAVDGDVTELPTGYVELAPRSTLEAWSALPSEHGEPAGPVTGSADPGPWQGLGSAPVAGGGLRLSLTDSSVDGWWAGADPSEGWVHADPAEQAADTDLAATVGPRSPLPTADATDAVPDWLRRELPDSGAEGARPSPVVDARPEAGPAAGPANSEAAPAPTGPAPVVVTGVLCTNGHLNNPLARFCIADGLSLQNATLRLVQGERPAFASLIGDDGTSTALRHDAVVGQYPQGADDVVAGRAVPIVVADPTNTVSGHHLAIRLVEWDAQVVDLGSAHGTFVLEPGAPGWIHLTPHQPHPLAPGTRIRCGPRTLRFERHDIR